MSFIPETPVSNGGNGGGQFKFLAYVDEQGRPQRDVVNTENIVAVGGLQEQRLNSGMKTKFVKIMYKHNDKFINFEQQFPCMYSPFALGGQFEGGKKLSLEESKKARFNVSFIGEDERGDIAELRVLQNEIHERIVCICHENWRKWFPQKPQPSVDQLRYQVQPIIKRGGFKNTDDASRYADTIGISVFLKHSDEDGKKITTLDAGFFDSNGKNIVTIEECSNIARAKVSVIVNLSKVWFVNNGIHITYYAKQVMVVQSPLVTSTKPEFVFGNEDKNNEYDNHKSSMFLSNETPPDTTELNEKTSDETNDIDERVIEESSPQVQDNRKRKHDETNDPVENKRKKKVD